MILVTAFEPFGGEKLNPAEMILNLLPDRIAGIRIRKLLLPVEFKRARELAAAEYDRVSPAAVIMLGQAGGRGAITPEAAGRNMMNGRIPDNAGCQPDHIPVVDGGPDLLWSTLPVDRIIRGVRALGIPCERSENAGEYVCNALLYGMLAHNGGAVPTGFIHVPYIREQGHEEQPFMELEAVCRGITAAIETVADEIAEKRAVRLEPVTAENLEAVLALRVDDAQKHFVSTAAESLAQAYVYAKTAFPFAVRSGPETVGFIMMGYYEKKKYYTLWKLMIDRKYQHRGYGRAALEQGIAFLREKHGAREIYTGVLPENHTAKGLYRSAGFEETGVFENGMQEMRLICGQA